MVLKGIVEEIIYRNTDNGYTVAVIDCNGENITAVGKFPQVTQGECVELDGSFVKHNRYGEQFNVSRSKIVKPTTKEGIVKYLSSGLIKGVGPVTALSIVNKFGEDTLDVIEFNHQKLTEVKGISERKANEIYDAFNEIRKMQNAVMLMQDYEISTNLAVKIYNTYFDKTETILKENPYKLCEDVDGIGFFTADRIARKMGISETSQFRFRAGVLHAMKESCDHTGNTYVTLANLESDVCELLKISIDMLNLNGVLNQMVMDSLIKIFEYDGGEIVVLTKYYNTEKIVGYTLNLFNEIYKSSDLNVDESIDLFEQLNHIKMHANQRDAVTLAVNKGVSVITGGPGTGKTTIVKCMLQIFKSMRKSVKLLAPTGRAAKRLSESTGEDASTIHRALVVDFLGSDTFLYNQHNKLPYDVVIVDEVSMVDIQLMYYLTRALKKGTQLVLVGDKDQLPSVGAGNVLADIISSGVISVCELTHIYRQDNDSLIISNAHLINDCKMPVLNNKSKDFFFEDKSEPSEMLDSIVNLTYSRLPKYLNIDSSRIQVLAPMKSGICGVDNLNKSLQEKINPPSLSKPEIETDKTIYRLGDRVMQITNNYDREWIKDTREQGAGVFNGDIGVIDHVDPNTYETTVLFEDGRYVKYNRVDLNELLLSYAITIHKSQGSEFDVVIIPVVAGAPMLLTKNLLYTAVTRAKRMVVLVGTKQNIFRMVHNKSTLTRNTLLKMFLLESADINQLQANMQLQPTTDDTSEDSVSEVDMDLIGE
ncbi:MAG TPA: ATP-dependent RecD-like DNA helicase [Clostridiales bacterium]|nr:ATP-dependent RecD-like DNA helicase [Clostridiales bacterium]